MNRPLCLLVIAGVAGSGCARQPERAAPASAAVGVSIIAVQSTALVSTFEAGGVVRSRTTAAIASRIMAPILEVHVRSGDRVRRGTPLVTLDDRETAANRSRAAVMGAGPANEFRRHGDHPDDRGDQQPGWRQSVTTTTTAMISNGGSLEGSPDESDLNDTKADARRPTTSAPTSAGL